MHGGSFFDAKWRSSGEFRPKIVAYYYKQWDEFLMGFHAHDATEFMYVISGICSVETKNEVIAMRKGDLIMLDAGVPHKLRVDKDSPCRMLNVEFTFKPCEGVFPSLNQLAEGDPALLAMLERQLDTIVLRDSADVQHILKSLVMELDIGGAGAGKETMTNLLISQLLVRVARLAAEDAKDSAERQIHRYVRTAAEYIHQHYDCDIQAKDVAAAVSLHPVYLQRIFKANMNVSITEYLTELRVERAKMLLASTDVPIIEVADYIGLNSRQYFSMLFKKTTGMSPAAYRKSAASIQSFSTL
ncbi:AraC family transcriptional regulator [Paenibacillus rhizovicinus]|uniref:AraC family transcriptional regulator n=1 Tax=Paenibacillus rhizovicinus TaxID=2704463 RepID=A0A6C0NYG5_9BACL|nr:AraC family transcriptional regulator [Paenibacillus rhizovicinus]QHW31248.1 AraC family transcriptional regulator [Paenibacillus rhizovicinus]